MSGAAVPVVGTIAIVTLGRWADDKYIDMRYVVGSGVYATIVAFLEQGNSKLASQIAWLVFVSALLIYTIPVAGKLGLISYGGFGAKK